MKIASLIGKKFDALMMPLGYWHVDYQHPDTTIIERKDFFSDVACGIAWLCAIGVAVFFVVRLVTAEPTVTRAEVRQIVTEAINKQQPPKAGQ